MCGGVTLPRTGKSGNFWGCLRYPDCTGIVNPPQRNTRRGFPKKKAR
ncbi:hypothetical protein [Serratia fonticola]